MALRTDLEFYINIAIAWALISFVATLALAKYLEGRPYDD
jgi:multicomponent Na+:H+ antiporter subunit F